ncbi:PAS domain-containing protein [Paenibacillus sacheonensis]|uniref:histidine kinase n=1 Tax=Paenibacillus sacheonensis TaxID=742054 RepID=A0A7X5BZJ1_9BACL|nr:PAS domain-containing protein [Paenibacillus sacheonensis]
MESRHTYIHQSHQNCLDAKLNPDDLPAPKEKLPKGDLEQKKRMLDDTISVARIFMTRLISNLQGTAVVICITDHEGYILETYGDEMIKWQIESLGLSPGILFEEEQVGTNSIEMALKMGQSAHTIGSDHFFRCLHKSACFSVPLHASGKICGTITMMMAAHHVSPYHPALLQSAVDSIEREVLAKKQNKKLLVLNQVLMENSRTGVILTDEDGRIIEINPYAEKVLSSCNGELCNRQITEVAVIGPYMGSVLSGNKKVEDVEISLSHNTFLFDSFPIYDESNRIIGVFAQFRDITERLVLERQLMLSEKLSAIGKIGAGLAHEIRNPLTSIIGLLALLKENFRPADHKQKDYFRIIFSELERIKNLVQQFVMMAKPDRKEVAKTRIGLHELIEDILALMEYDFQDKNIKIHYQPLYKENLEIDKDKIKQVILNILQNAFDAIDFDGNISVVIRQSQVDKGIEIVISDDGFGMDRDTVEKLATPFHSTKKYGLGLGLSMSYSIIELHKGRITVESENGKGTAFTIWLPRT